MLANKIKFANHLRANMTPPEVKLWRYLRKSPEGYSFKSQYVLLGWIADFWCPKLKLVIEVDGKQHTRAGDYHRDKTMNEHGITVWRIQASTVLYGDARKLIGQKLAQVKRGDKLLNFGKTIDTIPKNEWKLYLRRRSKDYFKRA